MQTSDSIKAISTALVAFHQEVGKIAKDAKNPFFKSKYASLSGILDAINEPLFKNGLSIVQFPEGETGLTTRLVHTSGEWMEATYSMKPVKDTPQDRGSALTYQRRYAVGAILSLNIDEDDDANAASGKAQVQQQRQSAPVATEKVDWEALLAKCTSDKDLIFLYNKYKAVVDAIPSLRDLFANRRSQINGKNVPAA